MRIYETFTRGDVPAILDQLAGDIDWWFFGAPKDVPFAGRYQTGFERFKARATGRIS